MAVKKINNIAGINSLVSILLVFGVYSRILEFNSPILIIS